MATNNLEHADFRGQIEAPNIRFPAGVDLESNDTEASKDWVRRRSNKNFISDGSFHEAVRAVLIIGQIFGLIPVSGLKSRKLEALTFSWTSPVTIHSLFVLILLLSYLMLTAYYTIHKLNLDNFGPVIFYSCALFASYALGCLAREWPELMRKWAEVEKNLPGYKSKLDKALLARRIKLTTLVFLTISLSEHTLNIISVVEFAHFCHPNEDQIKAMFSSQLAQLFFVTDYAVWKVVFGKAVNVIATFAWNYMDIFVIVVNVGLSHMFRQLNSVLEAVKGKATSEPFWREHRVHYRNLSDLCERVDGAISHITLISLLNNYYFICVQLLHSINIKPSVMQTTYFWFSLAFLAGKTLAVCLYAAEVNEESRKALKVFHHVPRDSWCLEVKRFTNEVRESVSMSGMRFVELTREKVVNLIGAIVTYELILIQFYSDDSSKPLC